MSVGLLRVCLYEAIYRSSLKAAWLFFMSLPFFLSERQQGECRGGEAVVHGVGGEVQEACGEHGGGAGDHGGYDGFCREASGEPEGEAQRQQQGGGAEAQGEEAEVVDEGPLHEVGCHYAQRQQGDDGQAEAAQGVAVDHIAHDDGGGAEHQAAAAAEDVD